MLRPVGRSTIVILVALALATSFPQQTRLAAASGGAQQPPIGDTKGDKEVDAEDAAVILQFDAGLLVFVRYPEEWDVSGDGLVGATDAALILQYSAGLISSLPP